MVALEEVLVGAAPGVVDAHRVVGGDRTVQERVALGRIVIAVQIFLEDVLRFPPGERLPFLRREIGPGVDALDSSCRDRHRVCVLQMQTR